MSKVFEYFNEFNEGDEPCCEGDVNNNCTCGEVEPTKEDIPGFEGNWYGLEELY